MWSNVMRPTTLIILVVVLILLFGAKRLPDAARSLGRSLRIMKAETRDLVSERPTDDLDEKADAQSGREPLRETGGSARGKDADADPPRAARPHGGSATAGEIVDPPERTRGD